MGKDADAAREHKNAASGFRRKSEFQQQYGGNAVYIHRQARGLTARELRRNLFGKCNKASVDDAVVNSFAHQRGDTLRPRINRMETVAEPGNEAPAFGAVPRELLCDRRLPFRSCPALLI